jgi:hypothetical protein
MSFEPIRIGNTVIRRSSSSSKYEIKNEASPFLMKSISSVINATDAKVTSATMTIEAADVLTMRNYLKRVRHATELYVALNLVHDLGRQMQALISAGRSIACIGVDDVIVIAHRDSDAFTHSSINDLDSTLGDNRMDPRFLFLNDHVVFELDDDGALIIDHALKTKGKGKDKSKYAFMSPELQHLSNDHNHAPHATPTHATPTHAPKSVHFKTVYYSAAQLIIYFLLNVDRIPDDTDDNAYMNPIKYTKLYWFLLRCLNPVPAERKYIYI